jgi:predicted Zn-dependent protease with MMP-like domain
VPRVDITRERFEELVGEALDGLPAWVLETMDNVTVQVEDLPPPGQPGLLGLYRGVPLSQRGRGYSNVLPDTITIYRATIMRSAGPDERRLKAMVAHTVAHEVAHHFGISDERLLEIDAY